MQGIVKVLDASGHTTLAYDTETGDGLEAAIAKFNATVTALGAAAFNTSVKPGERIIGPFDPKAQSEVTIVPQFQGG